MTLVLNWKRITKGIPSNKTSANDRAPTVEEIKKLVEYPDRRIKPIVYTMVSSGIRLGAWDYIQWKHIIPFTDKEGKIIAAKLLFIQEIKKNILHLLPQKHIIV